MMFNLLRHTFNIQTMESTPTSPHDFSHQAIHFIESYRTPYAILAAISCHIHFQMMHQHDTQNLTGIEKFATQQCSISFMVPAICSLIILLSATLAESTISRGEFDPVADSMYTLMMREFRFEYAAIQWCSIISILSFIRGVYLHYIIHNRIFPKHKGEEFAMIFADGLSLLAGILSYINVSLHSWDNLFDMTVDLVKVRDTLPKSFHVLLLFELICFDRGVTDHGNVHETNT